MSSASQPPTVSKRSSASAMQAQRGRYSVHCYIDTNDTKRQSEYQRLRADIFVHQFGWKVPVDSEGRERDHYDQKSDGLVNVHCVYGISSQGSEHFLGGVRVFQLRDWRDSMVMNEFRVVGMIPEHVLQFLQQYYPCTQFLELTRFCVQRGRWYTPPAVFTSFSNQIARDLTYATVFAQAQRTGRGSALALVDSRYLQVMKRSHFQYKPIYTHKDEGRGYTLVIIDLWETIRAMRAAGDRERVVRMLALCSSM